MTELLVIDSRVNGYKGAATRLVATCNVATGLVYISEEKPYKPKPLDKLKALSLDKLIQQKVAQSKTILVTDSPDNLANWDLAFFEKDHLTEVVRAYHNKKREGLLAIHESINGRYTPEDVLQQRKLDLQAGSVWELSTETENGHICVLLACWAAVKGAANYSFAQQVMHYEPEMATDSDDMDMPFTI